MSVLSSWGSVEAGKVVDGADGAMDTGIQAYRYRLSVEHLVGEAMRSSGTPNWKSRVVSGGWGRGGRGQGGHHQVTGGGVGADEDGLAGGEAEHLIR